MKNSALPEMNRRRFFATVGGFAAAPLLLQSFNERNSVLTSQSYARSNDIQKYNVIWDKPSTDASGQMPIGNGDITTGVYVIEGGELYLLLGKNDALTYQGDIFKTGLVKISLSPNPFIKGASFRQVMDMKTGSVKINAGNVEIKIWADANRPVYHVEINTSDEISVQVQPQFWNRFDHCLYNNFDVTEDGIQKIYAGDPTQDVRIERNGKIIWYFDVGNRSIFKEDMKYYDVEDMIGKFPDPFNYNKFGNLLESPDLYLRDGSLTGKGKHIDIRIHSQTKQTPLAEDWISAIENQAARPVRTKADWKQHCKWWSDFWERSWIFIADNTLPLGEKEELDSEGYKAMRAGKDGAALVSQSYNVFRYLMACQSRGRVQTKFNGGFFSQPLRCTEVNKGKLRVVRQEDGTLLSHPDDRDWGRRFTFQNQRLLYWPLIASGDSDLIKPFFNYYFNLLPVRKAITKAWFGHEGAYYRENIEPTGAERDCGLSGKPPKTKPGENKGKGYYHSYYFTSGLETTAMMIEYVKHSGDKEFQDNVLVPFAREALLFFGKHYLRDDNGKIRLDPNQALETWWITINSSPDIAGLQFCLNELLEMNVGSEEDKLTWKRFSTEIPMVHLHKIDGREAIAPALEWEMERNSENAELYPVFPFQLFGVAQGTEDLVEWTMEHRSNKDKFDYKCWTQDQIDWAYAGNAQRAQEGLLHRFRHASTQCRFPLYGSKGPDSCPDFDHFGSGSVALQKMLMQCKGKKIVLLPAWPKNWDVDFKLHAPENTTIKASVKNGKVKILQVTPESRRKDIVVRK